MSGAQTYAGRAQLEVANLAIQARTGALSVEGVLACTTRLGQLLAILADYEAAMDETASEAMHQQLLREAALVNGTVVALPSRPLYRPGHGGTAA